MAAMTTLLLLLLWAGVTVASQVDLHKRIFNGRDCGDKERPHHVMLVYKESGTNDGSVCGGTLISDRWILTAAHCDEPGWTLTAILGTAINKRKQHVITDPPVFFTDTTGTHDIMLLKLPKKILPTDVKPADLPKNCDNHPKNGAEVTVAGYDRTKVDSKGVKSVSEVNPDLPPQCINMPVVACPGCRINSPFVAPERFCYEGIGKGTTGGDSGGGVMYRGKLYGVHKAGDLDFSATPCEGFGLAMKVCNSTYLDWINRNIHPTGPSHG